MRSPKISVIVPIYNADVYLHRCINSILAQTFTDLEVLLINDGSTDKSRDICEEYAKLDSRVRVFHKENGGVSSARNVGIENMNGEYSIHVDSDDWIEPNMYYEMYHEAISLDADLVWSDFYLDKDNSQEVVCQSFDPVSDICVKNLILQNMHGALWNKLIKTEVIRENNLKFIDGVNLWEDLYFTIMVYSYAKVVSYLPTPFYHYVYRVNSIVNSKYSIEKVLMQIKVVNELRVFFQNDSNKQSYLDTMSTHAKSPLLLLGEDARHIWNSNYPISLNDIRLSKVSLKLKLLFILYHFRFYRILRFIFNIKEYVKRK